MDVQTSGLLNSTMNTFANTRKSLHDIAQGAQGTPSTQTFSVVQDSYKCINCTKLESHLTELQTEYKVR